MDDKIRSDHVRPWFNIKKWGSVQTPYPPALCADCQRESFWRAGLREFSWRQRGVGIPMVNLPTVVLFPALFYKIVYSSDKCIKNGVSYQKSAALLCALGRAFLFCFHKY